MPRCLVEHFAADVPIPVREHLKNRKLAKYFNRETAAAIVCASRLLDGCALDRLTPFHYAMEAPQFEDYGLAELHALCCGDSGMFEPRAYIERGVPTISPLTQFKVLYNMPLCFVAIEHGLQGDSSVHYGSATSLFEQVALSPHSGTTLIGAGRTHRDGAITMGMALVDPSEVERHEATESVLDVLSSWSEKHP